MRKVIGRGARAAALAALVAVAVPAATAFWATPGICKDKVPRPQPKPSKPDIRNPDLLGSPVPSLDKGELSQAPEFQALLHARQGGVVICTDTLARLLPQVIDAPHEAFSFWSQKDADMHLFGSICGQTYVQKAAPRAASVVAVSPLKSGKCDGVGVQVVPSARSCGTLQSALLKDGRAIANLQGLPLIQNAQGIRYLLLPTAGNGCVIVATASVFAK